MLTACREVAARVNGLKLGADDYLTKPFDMAELSARVEARVRTRTVSEPGERWRFGTIEVDLRGTQVRRGGVPIALSTKEFRLLLYFLRRPGITVERDQILDDVWGRDAMPSTRTVDVHVAWLRRKLEPCPGRPRFILTVHGRGYKFVA
jgi:DNA-binding response OmpR family regulator